MNGTHRLAQAPPGVQCFVGEEARRRRRIEEAVVSVFEGWDYEEIIPPLFDYADVFTAEALVPKTYSFVGRDGSVLALRHDFTSLLANIAAGRLRGVVEQEIGRAVCRDHAHFVRHAQAAQRLGGVLHGLPVRAGAHHDADERRTVGRRMHGRCAPKRLL